MTTRYRYAELYTLPDEAVGFRKATFIDPFGKATSWSAQSYDVHHLNQVAAEGWRVVSRTFFEPDNFTYLLEQEQT